jgi:hypothetical protein
MKKAPSYIALLKKFDKSPTDIQRYFAYLPALIEDNQYEVALAYLFLRTEMAQNRTLYCGVVKLHHAHTEVAQTALHSQHLTRDGFLDLYESVFGDALPPIISDKLKHAEKIRDKVIHGKLVKDPEMREAIYEVIDYAEQMNMHLQAKAGFQPFGDLRGFRGRANSLDKSTTRWLLKGIGFAIS